MPSDTDVAGPLREALPRPTSPTTASPRRSGGRPPRARSQRDPPGPAAYDVGRAARHPGPAVPAPDHRGRDEAERALPGLVDRLCTPGSSSRASARSRRASTSARTPAGRGPRPLGRQRPHARPRRRPEPGRPRPRARHQPSASTSLAQLTIREPVGSALDLGTGCGVQALHLAGHSGPGRRHRRQRPGALDDPAQRRAQRGRGRRARRLLLRAGRGGAVRPDRDQPAVRDLAGDR